MKKFLKKFCMVAVTGLSGIFLCTHAALAQDAAQPEDPVQAATCTKLLGSAIHNQILESACGFNGGVFQKVVQQYNAKGCGSIVQKSTVDQMSQAALDDTKKQLVKSGTDAFCKSNASAYNALR